MLGINLQVQPLPSAHCPAISNPRPRGRQPTSLGTSAASKGHEADWRAPQCNVKTLLEPLSLVALDPAKSSSLSTKD
ncbi:hypothetical protein E2562_014900 [Oryza meyeriana var. granulata]|uniref:Uncharacterized protein n=1 Tax=Oryza meyeriana var. granulata TaxID=110450 RepID=A0A6G1EK59_9ORYZ|nr:hypothetical protein E2562_014900 [Oryza meyeriana var. granulata]